MSQLPYVVILTVVAIVIIGVLISWSVTIKVKPDIPAQNSVTKMGYGMRCTNNPVSPNEEDPITLGPQDCGEGLVCSRVRAGDPWGFCKKAIGQRCNTLSECEKSAKSCNRICSATVTGGLDQPCKSGNVCESGLVCDSKINVCKIPINGGGCFENEDCVEGTCQRDGNQRICRLRKQDGSPCIDNKDCLSDNCDGRWCQPIGIRTGELGAGCVYYKQGTPSCDEGLTCFVDNLEEKLGICVNEMSSWTGLKCSDALGCIPPTVCVNGICQMPKPTMTCKEGESSGICSPGYECKSNICEPGDKVPSLNGKISSLFRWNGRWIREIGNIPKPNIGSISSVNFGANSIVIYKSGLDFYLLPIKRDKSYKITFDGPYNGNVKLTRYQNFDIDHVRFTVDNRLAISYSWIYRSVRVFRIYISSYPDSWLNPNETPSTTVRYQITWPGMTPNTDIEPGSSQATEGNFHFFRYTISGGGNNATSSIENINHFDFDDRGDSGSNIRLLLVTKSSHFFTTLTTEQKINDASVAFSEPQTNPLVQRAFYYSYQKGEHDKDAYIYNTGNEIIVNNSELVFPANENKEPNQILSDYAFYSPQGSDLPNSTLSYIMNFPSTRGYQLFNQQGFSHILPGYFNNESSISVSLPVLGSKTPEIFLFGKSIS